MKHLENYQNKYEFTKPGGNNINIKSIAILHGGNHKLEGETLKDFIQNSNTHMITTNKDKENA